MVRLSPLLNVHRTEEELQLKTVSVTFFRRGGGNFASEAIVTELLVI